MFCSGSIIHTNCIKHVLYINLYCILFLQFNIEEISKLHRKWHSQTSQRESKMFSHRFYTYFLFFKSCLTTICYLFILLAAVSSSSISFVHYTVGQQYPSRAHSSAFSLHTDCFENTYFCVDILYICLEYIHYVVWNWDTATIANPTKVGHIRLHTN